MIRIKTWNIQKFLSLAARKMPLDNGAISLITVNWFLRHGSECDSGATEIFDGSPFVSFEGG
jgi:hypothetical protein